MFVIVVRTHGGEHFEAYRTTREGAERYARLLYEGGISLPGRWLNPSNILEVMIHEKNEEVSAAPKLAANSTTTPGNADGGKRKPRGAVRRVSQ